MKRISEFNVVDYSVHKEGVCVRTKEGRKELKFNSFLPPTL